VNVRAAARQRPLDVLIAGGGIAAIEALLTLCDLAPERVRIELLAPEPQFVHRPLFVAEPFGIAEAQRLELADVAREHGAALRADGLASVDPTRQTVTTAGGEEVRYEALLVAIGASPVQAVPGAVTFGDPREREFFAALLGQLGSRAGEQLVFLVAPEVKWSLAAYELALLTVSHLEARSATGVKVAVVTHEAKPLEILGAPASGALTEVLEAASVGVVTSANVTSYESGAVRLADGGSIRSDHAVALPALEVPTINGLPQRRRGFLPTDTRMQVAGLDRVWAAGDVTWFPIKQGELAAQQAEVAAHAIAATAGARVPTETFRPALRTAAVTGAVPRLLQSPAGPATEEPSWWAPAKAAGRYLGPYLATQRRRRSTRPREEAPEGMREAVESEAEHREAVEFALAAADSDARLGNPAGALEWLDLVEEMNLVIPAIYVERRRRWERAAG
jgi:sulfide:quinone oxidoreductase